MTDHLPLYWIVRNCNLEHDGMVQKIIEIEE